jgi:hypothetical protein
VLALLTMHTSRPDVDRLKEDAPMAAAKPHMCAEIEYAPKVATGQATARRSRWPPLGHLHVAAAII